MRYLILLAGDEALDASPGTAAWDEEMAGYERFGEVAASRVVGGEALRSSATARTIRHAGAEPLVTAGPFAETTEVVGGFYVLDVADLDEGIELARQIPAAAYGSVELRPLVEWFDRGPGTSPTPDAPRWLALIWSAETPAEQPGTAEWDSGAEEHARFIATAGDRIRSGAALHPVATATTVRVRDGEVLITDGPYAEMNEVIGGFYLFDAMSEEEASQLAAAIPSNPAGAIELRPILEVDV